jgi:hypothetical protein
METCFCPQDLYRDPDHLTPFCGSRSTSGDWDLLATLAREPPFMSHLGPEGIGGSAQTSPFGEECMTPGRHISGPYPFRGNGRTSIFDSVTPSRGSAMPSMPSCGSVMPSMPSRGSVMPSMPSRGSVVSSMNAGGRGVRRSRRNRSKKCTSCGDVTTAPMFPTNGTNVRERCCKDCHNGLLTSVRARRRAEHSNKQCFPSVL